jgi:hypothetical protein
MRLPKQPNEQRRRYRQLSAAHRAKVDQIVKRHIAACAEFKVNPEIEPTLREAIDLVLAGAWEPDPQPRGMEPRWRYEVYIAPKKEAA